MSKKITTSVQTEGFEAVLYPGDGRKDKIVAALEDQISHGDLGRMAAFRRNKITL